MVSFNDYKNKKFNASVLALSSLADAEQVIREVGVDEDYPVKLMANKALFRVIKVFGVRNAIANIMKQEMLSIGGDIAVHKGCVNCTVNESDLVIMGTVRQFRLLITRMKIQVSESSKVVDAVEKALNDSLK